MGFSSVTEKNPTKFGDFLKRFHIKEKKKKSKIISVCGCHCHVISKTKKDWYCEILKKEEESRQIKKMDSKIIKKMEYVSSMQKIKKLK